MAVLLTLVMFVQKHGLESDVGILIYFFFPVTNEIAKCDNVEQWKERAFSKVSETKNAKPPGKLIKSQPSQEVFKSIDPRGNSRQDRRGGKGATNDRTISFNFRPEFRIRTRT